MHKARRNITRVAWRLAKCYWTSEEKWSAWALLVGVIGLNLGNVYISVRINEWNRSFYNALQAFDRGELFRQIGGFCILVFFAISMSVYGLYLSQMLQIRWRRWLTNRYLNAWLAERAYYQLELGGRTDNPDQRIAEDLNQFTTYLLSLSVVFIRTGRHCPWHMDNPACPCLSGVGGIALCGHRDLADNQNRSAISAVELCSPEF